MTRNHRQSRVGIVEEDEPDQSTTRRFDSAQTSSSVIVDQPKNAVNKMMDLPILNAHEFAPHPSINVLSAFDVLIVKENSEFYSKYSGDMKRNKYQVVTHNGSLIYNVIEGTTNLKAKFLSPKNFERNIYPSRFITLLLFLPPLKHIFLLLQRIMIA